MKQIFECEIMSRSAKMAQLVIALPIGLLGGYLLINFVNTATHQRLFIKGFLVPAFIIFVAGIVAEIVIWYRMKGSLRVSRDSDNSLQILIEFPSGIKELAKGDWTTEGIYTKEYEKLGMYKKHLALHLSCNQKPFCLLRHDLAPVKPEPQHFRLVNELYNRGGTEYWCKKTEELHELLQKEYSFKK